MADGERRAEIEAVILFVCPECWKVGSESERCVHYVGGSRGHDHYKRVPVRLALDRVRDARDDDEADRLANDLAGDWRDCLPMRPLRPPQDEGHETLPDENG